VLVYKDFKALCMKGKIYIDIPLRKKQNLHIENAQIKELT